MAENRQGIHDINRKQRFLQSRIWNRFEQYETLRVDSKILNATMKCTIRIMLKYFHELFIWEKFCIADRSSHRISSVEKKTVREHVRNVFIRWRSIHVRYISHDSSFRKGKRIRSESTAFNHRCSGNVIFRAWIVGGDQLFGLIRNNSSHCNKLFFFITDYRKWEGKSHG